MAARPQPETRDLLLSAAEQILVTRGVHALSVRQVGEMAGLNGTLVTYHFGGIGGLLEELAQQNMAPMVEAWSAIENAEEARDILAAWLKPLLLPAAYHPAARALVVLDEIAAHASAQQSDIVLQQMIKAAMQVEAALSPKLPALARGDVRARLRFIAGAALGPPPRTRGLAGSVQESPENSADALLRFAAAALELPSNKN
ncbi:MAG: TetR family transcriptional regulator [Sphingomonadaceae bacterium]|nr:TetR family transcriptional regulator [Sphingomonadaceae bacterium]